MLTRMVSLREQVAKTAYDYAVLMYMLAYYGQLWQLDSMLEDGASPFVRVTPRQASIAVLTQVLVMEAKQTKGDTTVYAALGKEWRRHVWHAAGRDDRQKSAGQ